MPYARKRDLPESVRNNLPEHAQDIFRKAFNSASEDYKDPEKRRQKSDDPEEIAFKVAWAAVKEKYAKKGGRWVAKREG